MDGTYFLTLAITSQDEATVYDWQEQQYSFMVSENMALGAGEGIVHVEGRWKLAPASVTS